MSRKDFVASVVIILAAIMVVMVLSAPVTHTRIVSDATLSAYGEFDRIELSDRHTDWFSGVEVEGIKLASLNESGTVSIAKHPRSFTKNTTFFFLLRVYAGVNHTTSDIAVDSGEVSEYEFEPDIVVTVSLTTVEDVVVLSNPGFAALTGMGFAIFLSILYYMYKTW